MHENAGSVVWAKRGYPFGILVPFLVRCIAFAIFVYLRYYYWMNPVAYLGFGKGGAMASAWSASL